MVRFTENEYVSVYIGVARIFHQLRGMSGYRTADLEKNRIADKSLVQTSSVCCSIVKSKQIKWHRWQHNAIVDKTKVRKTN